MNKMPEEIFLDYLDDKNWILSGTSPLSEDQKSYTLTSLTDRRDAVDALLATYERIIGPGRYPSIDREIAALEEARNV